MDFIAPALGSIEFGVHDEGEGVWSWTYYPKIGAGISCGPASGESCVGMDRSERHAQHQGRRDSQWAGGYFSSYPTKGIGQDYRQGKANREQAGKWVSSPPY